MNKGSEKLKVEDFIKRGAMVEINFYGCKDKIEAAEALMPYTNLGDVFSRKMGSTQWLEIIGDKMEFVAYYERG